MGVPQRSGVEPSQPVAGTTTGVGSISSGSTGTGGVLFGNIISSTKRARVYSFGKPGLEIEEC
jgi:hypothetical protein